MSHSYLLVGAGETMGRPARSAGHFIDAIHAVVVGPDGAGERAKLETRNQKLGIGKEKKKQIPLAAAGSG
jgi:hypothetical protein